MNASILIGKLHTPFLGLIITTLAVASRDSSTDDVPQTSPYYVEATSPTIKEIGIVQIKPAFHPRKLLLRGIFQGWTKVCVAIDENGKLLDALVLGYSHPEFGESTKKALDHWEFAPAQINGEAISSVIELNFNYNQDHSAPAIISTNAFEYTNNRFAKDRPEENKLVRLSKLDRIPTPLHIVSPAYSPENVRLHAGERVVVKFYIDEEGNVRLPVLSYADNPTIARQALAAVAQWRFEPPTRKGKAVITRASQEFVFKATKESITDE